MLNLANAIKLLAADMIQKANSGHPGMPFGMADLATCLFANHLVFNPEDPLWHNRDRFILSNGHGSALLYACLYLTGYENITLEELKKFRQLHSHTPGHPEIDQKSGIETTTGPLGQGIANGVGMALSAKMAQARFGEELFDHKIWVFCGDGCLQEGISHEACSFAGHLKLNNLIIIYDHNNITIDGQTSLSFSDNTALRFKAYGFEVFICDGHNYEEINNVYSQAKSAEAPVLIIATTVIANGAPNLAGSEKAHGSALGEQEISAFKIAQNLPLDDFSISEEHLKQWRAFKNRNISKYKSSIKQLQANEYFKNFINQPIPNLQNVQEASSSEATRTSSGRCIEFLTGKLSRLVGGSADLTPSNNTFSKHHKNIAAGDFSGNYIRYGVREHAMAAIMNGIAIDGIFIPYSGTFLVFSDYMRPSLRLAALMRIRSIHVLTHDSIGVGEDGPTHQPIEHIPSLRLIPNMLLLRPCDANETTACWKLALNNTNGPTILALSRQNLPQLNYNNRTPERGGYILTEAKNNHAVTIFASGSEVHLALQAADLLEEENIGVRVISCPSLEIFDRQDSQYIQSLLCNNTLKVAIEASAEGSWHKYIGPHGIFFGMKTFGESAPGSDLFKFFGFDVTIIANIIKEHI